MNLLINKFKEKINNKTVVGSWIQIGNPTVTEIMAASGFDFLVVDLEHSVIGLSDLQILFHAIGNYDSMPLVRISSNDPVQIKRVMDAGSMGIIVPNVCTPDEARMAVKAVKYPPQGERGVGISRAQGYGANFKEYFDTINSDSVVIVQIEHKEAVRNIEGIIDVDGIDGVMIGPYDLSASYGVPGELEHQKVREARELVKKAVQNKNKAVGTHVVWPSLDKFKDSIKEEFDFIVFSSDMLVLQYNFNEAVKSIDEILKE